MLYPINFFSNNGGFKIKTITVDENSHAILMWAKRRTHDDGIENPTHSDAIRWMKDQIEDLVEEIENKKGG